MYRPPDSTKESFNWSVRNVNNWLRKIQKKHDGVRMFINGDFNLGKLNDWSEDSVNSVRDKIYERVSNRENIGVESAQMMEAIDFADKWNLEQKIKNPTREDRILDLLFTSDDIESDIKHERHAYISDHDTIIVKVDLEIT